MEQQNPNVPPAERTLEPVREQAKKTIEGQKSATAERLDRVAEAIRETAKSLEEKHEPRMAGVMGKAADKVERFSRNLRSRDLKDLMSEAEDFARRHPVAFFAGAAVAGFVLARFLKGGRGEAAGEGETPIRETEAGRRAA